MVRDGKGNQDFWLFLGGILWWHNQERRMDKEWNKKELCVLRRGLRRKNFYICMGVSKNELWDVTVAVTKEELWDIGSNERTM